MLDEPMPWYTALLGAKPKGKDFERLVSQFELSNKMNVKSGWYESEEGISVCVLDGRVEAIQFFSPEHPDFKGFSGELPLGVSFEMMRDEVRKRLGAPNHVLPERGNGIVPHAGMDRYYAPHCTVLVVYSASSGRVEVLGFERPKASRPSAAGNAPEKAKRRERRQ